MTHRPLVLLPAVDVTGGRATQLVQGVAGSGKIYGDPVEAALAWQRAGAHWLHLVDLDAAFRRGHNREVLEAVVGALDIPVELSGGIRDDDSLRAALATGCARVNIGTAALEHPAWCARVIGDYREKIAVGLDVRTSPDLATGERPEPRLSARGWTRDGGPLWEALARLDAQGCERYVVTDINRDGTLTGPNTRLLLEVAARTTAPVIASGGITTLADVAALAALTDSGIEGAIIGTALYEGTLQLPDALQVARGH